jgi:hypothetical protein
VMKSMSQVYSLGSRGRIFFFGDRESEQWELFHDNTQQMRRKVVGGVEGSGEPF